MVADDRFTRAFGDEFFCVRRPSYYSFLYAGRPMDGWQKSRQPRDPLKQFPRNGGGLCMFWSPDFGSSLLARNWSVEAAQSIIAVRADGTTDWEEYWSVSNKLDAEHGTADITGNLGSTPIRFDRNVQFHDDRVIMDLQLEATSAIELKAMFESFPFPLDKPASLRAVLVNDQGRPVESGMARGIAFLSDLPQAHLVVFDQPRQCSVGTVKSTDDYGRPREHGRVLAALPAHCKPGAVHHARWSIAAVPAGNLSQGVDDAIRVMSR
jgi:hypothetical protein